MFLVDFYLLHFLPRSFCLSFSNVSFFVNLINEQKQIIASKNFLQKYSSLCPCMYHHNQKCFFSYVFYFYFHLAQKNRLKNNPPSQKNIFLSYTQ